MVTTVRIDGCADHMNKKSDLIIKKHKIMGLLGFAQSKFAQGTSSPKKKGQQARSPAGLG